MTIGQTSIRLIFVREAKYLADGKDSVLDIADHTILSLNPIAMTVKHAMTLFNAEDFDSAIEKEFKNYKTLILATDSPEKLGALINSGIDVASALLGLTGDDESSEKVEKYMSKFKTASVGDEEVQAHIDKLVPDDLLDKLGAKYGALDVDSTEKVGANLLPGYL